MFVRSGEKKCHFSHRFHTKAVRPGMSHRKNHVDVGLLIMNSSEILSQVFTKKFRIRIAENKTRVFHT